MMEAGAIVLAIAVAGVLVYWFVFRWDAPKKKWCVMFYMTSNTPASAAPVNRPAAEIGIPSAASAAVTLDDKLDQVVERLRQLPCATKDGIEADLPWDDVYVAYRAVWDDPLRSPEARVVRPELSAPARKYFDGETVFDVGYAIDFTKDLTLFFQWAYDNCPADQYAVFFWGHAMGPAGFFQPSERPVIVSPLMALLMKIFFFLTGNRWSGTLGLRAISDAIGALVEERFMDGGGRSATVTLPAGLPIAGGAPPGPSSGGTSTSTPTASGSVVFQVGQTVPKVDVALFQDCWMSTLETAFELQDNVQYIVSSQSLVPAGFDSAGHLGAIWPYKEIIDTFLTSPKGFTAAMMNVLNDFFDGVHPPEPAPGHNRYPAKKVLFSLVDCGTTAGSISSAMRTEFQTLVQELNTLGALGRAALIDDAVDKAGRLFELSGNALEVGDQALIDVLTLCAWLRSPSQWPATVAATPAQQSTIQAAAVALEAKVAGVIAGTFESPPPSGPANPLYTGLAVLYKPHNIQGDDPFVVSAFRYSYERFRFARETDVNPPPPPATYTSANSWTEYAFERHNW